MGINWKVRFKNPLFWVQVCGAILLTALSYRSMEPSQLTDWALIWEIVVGIVKNPYLLALCAMSVWNAINDPTVAGVNDSALALTYKAPKVSSK